MHLTLHNKATVALLQEVPIIRRQITQLRLLRLGELTLSSLITLSVLEQTSEIVDDARRGTEADKADRDGISLLVEGLRVALQKDEGRDDASDVAEGDLPGGTDGAAVVAAEVHVKPADHDGHGGVTAHSDEEESLEILLGRKLRWM